MYDMERSLWYIVSFEKVVEHVCVSIFPFSILKKVTIRKPKIGCTHKTMCIYILKYYIICMYIKKGLEGSHYQENSRPG